MTPFEQLTAQAKELVNGTILTGKKNLLLVCPRSSENLIKAIGLFSAWGVTDFKPATLTEDEMTFTFFNK